MAKNIKCRNSTKVISSGIVGLYTHQPQS